MAGYAIQARIVGVRPRLSARAARGVGQDDQPAPEVDQRAQDVLAVPLDQRAEDELAVPLDQRAEDELAVPLDQLTPTLSERHERGRELWSQTTFFLFDPNSWR